MIRCRKCGITYKNDATLCLRCMNPFPKPTGKVIPRKPVRKEVLDKIIAEKKPKNVLIATATPLPRKIFARAHNTTPLPNTNLQKEISVNPLPDTNNITTTPIIEVPNTPVINEKISSDVTEHNLTDVSKTTESTSIITSSEDSNDSLRDLTENKPAEKSFMQEFEKIISTIKDVKPDDLIEELNPLFGKIRVDEFENLFNIISKLDQIDEMYVRSPQRILFDRGYVLDSGYITHLNIFNLEISVLPSNLDSLKRLTSLDLEKNKFEIFPDGLEKLVSLESLNISENKLQGLPHSVGKLTKLKSLQLYDNEISILPNNLSLLKNLEYLDLRGNKLNDTSLDVIYQLTKLKYLSLESNNLRSLSGKIDNLMELEVLLVGHNPIEILPDISNLKNLRELSLYGTNLKYVPESILFLPGLQKLDIWNTGIKSDDWLLAELKEAGVSINMSGM